jgi:hypothetical protein
VENGARIITMSLGIKGEIPSAFLRNDRFNAEAIRSTGTILFNSAGNYTNEFDPPIEPGMTARIPSPWNALSVPHSSTGGVVTVGGTGYQSDEPYAEGSRGPVTWGQIDPWFDWPYVPGPGLLKPDVSAPAVGIRSTLPPSLYSGETWSGTSMACPHLAGVAALMLQKNPTLSPVGIDSLIQLSARDLGNAGKDVVFGAGLVDAYAAVNSVPMDYLPNLDKVVYRPDPEGNGVVDPGELMPLAFDVTNVGIVLAEDVTGQLVIESNPHVSVLVESAQFPDLAPGETRGNDADPFRLAISPLAPQGFSFVMELTISTGEGFERTFDLKGFVGLPEFRTHDAGQVFLTVTARGSLGYLTDAQLNGDGMGLIGGPSALFVSSLWGGDSAAYVCNNDLTASGADPADWTPRLDPVGNVAILQDGTHEQIFAMAFTDSGHASPHDIEVTLVSHAYATTDREDAVLLEYLIRNRGNRPHPAYYAGLFVDWDVVDLMSNVGAVDMGTRSVWIGVPDGPVFGMAVAGDTPAANISLVDNLVYVYPLSHVTDTHKYQLLSGQLSQPEATEPTDLSAICAAGPFSLEPGEVARATFIMTYGDDVEDFLANVVAAGGGGGPVSVVEHPETDLPTPNLMLGQNHPNPFNPSTAIAFALPAGGPVELAVFDVAGRRVRTLVSEALDAGQHTVLWDGRDEAGNQAASGIYLYKLVTETRTLTRKMMLVK